MHRNYASLIELGSRKRKHHHKNTYIVWESQAKKPADYVSIIITFVCVACGV